MKKLAFVFAGQGAQYPGMGAALYEKSPAARRVFDEAESVHPGIRETCFSGSQEALRETVNTQPCLFVVDLACAYALEERGIRAQAAAGFSLGELPAAVYAGLLSFRDGLELVLHRAAHMQAAAERHPGAMVAVLRLPAEEVAALAEEFQEAYPVNYNCPGQTVVAVGLEELDAFTKEVKLAGGRAVRLAVSGAFHSPFMREAAALFYEDMRGVSFHPPAIPLYANATAEPYGEDPAGLLSRQIKSPVLWQRTIEAMRRDGVDALIEVGAGKTLSGLIKKIDADVFVTNVEDADTLEKAVEQWKGEEDT